MVFAEFTVVAVTVGKHGRREVADGGKVVHGEVDGGMVVYQRVDDGKEEVDGGIKDILFFHIFLRRACLRFHTHQQ
jgi:hypothetical protein